MIFIDSNIWCYYFNEGAKEHEKVVHFVESLMDKESIAMNNVVGLEVAHFLIKNLGAIKGKEKMKLMLEFPFLIDDLDYDTLLDSIEALAQYTHTGIGGRDASILTTMKKKKIKKIVTHDKAFKKIDFVEVIDPIS
jgi:uncharacterized protein